MHIFNAQMRGIGAEPRTEVHFYRSSLIDRLESCEIIITTCYKIAIRADGTNSISRKPSQASTCTIESRSKVCRHFVLQSYLPRDPCSTILDQIAQADSITDRIGCDKDLRGGGL